MIVVGLGKLIKSSCFTIPFAFQRYLVNCCTKRNCGNEPVLHRCFMYIWKTNLLGVLISTVLRTVFVSHVVDFVSFFLFLLLLGLDLGSPFLSVTEIRDYRNQSIFSKWNMIC